MLMIFPSLFEGGVGRVKDNGSTLLWTPDQVRSDSGWEWPPDMAKPVVPAGISAYGGAINENL